MQLREQKDKLQNGEVSANHISNREPVSRTYKEHLKLNNKKTTQLKMGKRFT